MNRFMEIAALLLGGISLFTVCFVGFLGLSGKPMHEVALIGKFFEAPAGDGEDGSATAEHAEGGDPASEEADAGHEKRDDEVIEASLGMLGAWTLPAPYTTSELRTLADELKRRLHRLEERDRGLDLRERGLEEQSESIAARTQDLESLRKELEAFEAALAERESVLQRGEKAELALRESKWSELGKVIAGLESEEAASRIAAYTPQEAAQILVTLGDGDRAVEILNQMQGERWKEYVDAYTDRSAADTSTRRK